MKTKEEIRIEFNNKLNESIRKSSTNLNEVLEPLNLKVGSIDYCPDNYRIEIGFSENETENERGFVSLKGMLKLVVKYELHSVLTLTGVETKEEFTIKIFQSSFDLINEDEYSHLLISMGALMANKSMKETILNIIKNLDKEIEKLRNERSKMLEEC
ncbi:MAG: hypothetical protein NC235_07555 [Clostridiales bacterium]|nr:hypothetical protein [Clostridiales bacterium]MCM1576987.1 hypothetical protein [Bacteroides sp.]